MVAQHIKRKWNAASAHKGQPMRYFVVPVRVDRRTRALARWERQLIAARFSESWPIRLWAGVLYDSYFTLMRSPSWAKVKRELQWVRDTASEPLGTFESICLVLDLEVETVRSDMLRRARTQSVYAKRRK